MGPGSLYRPDVLVDRRALLFDVLKTLSVAGGFLAIALEPTNAGLAAMLIHSFATGPWGMP